MPVSDEILARYQGRYLAATGESARRFMCPILLRDDPDVELCEGHVLPQSALGVSRNAVPARKDVDNAFSQVEAEFVWWLNIPHKTNEEILAESKSFQVHLEDGITVQAFYASAEASARFQRVELYRSDGSVLATPYFREGRLSPGRHTQLPVTWERKLDEGALTASAVKAAYLALFRLLGYQYALSAAGTRVRRALADFCASDRGRVARRDSFAQFKGCIGVALSDRFENEPDVTAGRMLFHIAEGDARSGLIFAQSVPFRVKSGMFLVTVPACNREGYVMVAWDHYQSLLKDRTYEHAIHIADLADDNWNVHEQSLLLPVKMDQGVVASWGRDDRSR